jgi:uncharacterized damage-inducible protein DinB
MKPAARRKAPAQLRESGPRRYSLDMAIKDALLPEFDHEMGTTRRLLERVPEADFGWKPHEKSFSLGHLAAHIANIPSWGTSIMGSSYFDAAEMPEDARPKAPESTAALLAAFDKNIADDRARLASCTDSEMMSTWTLKNNGAEVFTMPKAAVIRSFILSHSIHHRGQLSVYLRLRNVPLPSIYGPTADEA